MRSCLLTGQPTRSSACGGLYDAFDWMLMDVMFRPNPGGFGPKEGVLGPRAAPARHLQTRTRRVFRLMETARGVPTPTPSGEGRCPPRPRIPIKVHLLQVSTVTASSSSTAILTSPLPACHDFSAERLFTGRNEEVVDVVPVADAGAEGRPALVASAA